MIYIFSLPFFQTAEQERALREQGGQANEAQPSYASDIKQEEVHGTTLENGRCICFMSLSCHH